MLNFLKKTLKDTKGAMDKILVTLLLVIIAVGLVVGLGTWMTNEINVVKNQASERIVEVLNDPGLSASE
ncbi:MAG: hypothetical protein RBQ81_08935 [Arcobacteraceae bacterium]|jgi:phosphotransferase system  glucose/maltose/N-acetylglucosamine-specific IIC component|nr:hypothetical protein [Arcobacteraceae bacterium]